MTNEYPGDDWPDDAVAYGHPGAEPFQTPRQVYRHLQPPTYLGDRRLRALVARVLSRVPAWGVGHEDGPDSWRGSAIMLGTISTFVTAEPGKPLYLSARFVEGRGVVVVPAYLLDRPEEEQVEAILPLAAQCLIKARSPFEFPLSDFNPSESDADRHQRAEQFAVESRDAQAEAERLARAWITRWEKWKWERPRNLDVK